MSVQMTEIRVYTNGHRYICLSAREHPPRNASSEHCRAPVLQHQPSYCAAMHVTEATRGMFHGQTHHFRGLGAARDAKMSTVCGTLSSHWPLWFCLPI